ncbi:MAG TPA: hypothetical protein VH643_24730 [Gemmataceae bacterium]|jgi:hypothetical protein
MTRYFVLALLMTLLVLPMYLVAPDEPIRREPTSLPASDEGGHDAQAISEKDAREIGRLIQQLSSSSFAEREAAARRLKRIGNPAVPLLRAAGTGKGADLELRRRAELLVDKILTKDFPQRFGESIAVVEKLLPSGWSILRTVSGSTPPDWWTDDPKAGFLIEARNGNEVLQIWFLPLDWIGIRKTRNRAWRSVYGQGILTGDKYKTITYIADDKLHEWFSRRLGSEPSLINGGYSEAMRIFAGKLERADRIAAALVRKHCHTSKQFNEAISSLDDLGVPARNLFLRGARYARAGKIEGVTPRFLACWGGKTRLVYFATRRPILRCPPTTDITPLWTSNGIRMSASGRRCTRP